MRIAVILIVGLLSMFALWFSTQRQPSSESQDVLELLKNNALGLEAADVTLERCQLSIRRQIPAAQGAAAQFFALDADLSLFKFQSVRVSDPSDTGVMLVIERKPTSDALVEQAARIIGAFPPVTNGTDQTQDQSSDAQASSPLIRDANGQVPRDKVRAALDKPGATLTFQLTTQIPEGALENGEEFTPHKDAPKFFAFSDAVLGLEAPRTFAVNQVFRGVDRSPDDLIIGTVTLPPQLRFVVASQDAARELGEALFRYTKVACKG